MAGRTCCIHGCGRKIYGLLLCNTHYLRLRKTGTTVLRERKREKCRMPACESPSRKHRWCSKHWQRIVKNGSPMDRAQKWTIRDFAACTVCGGDLIAGSGFRRYCSRSCAVIANRGARPAVSACGRCGDEMDMTARSGSGRLVNSNRSYCQACCRGVNLRKYVRPLFERDGSGCSLCGSDIDMTLKYPHPMSRSVDHVLPRSLGGTEDMANLALSHNLCNVTKQARVGFTMPNSATAA